MRKGDRDRDRGREVVAPLEYRNRKRTTVQNQSKSVLYRRTRFGIVL